MRKLLLFLVVALILAATSYTLQAQVQHTNSMDNEQCYECHKNKDFVVKKGDRKINFYVNREQFENSVHGKMKCISCHDFNKKDEDISNSCGRCHADAQFYYQRSIHQEEDNGPNCIDCHGSHEILKVDSDISPANSQNQYKSCGACHQQAASQYQESFHGKAVALGAKNSPSCTYCHGAHEVLSSDNPDALTSESKTSSICSDCHEGEVLGINAVEHYTMEPQGFGAPMYWTKKIFMWLILLVVGFFLIHILLDLIHKLRTRRS